MSKIVIETLKASLTYEPGTGLLAWVKPTRKSIRPGAVAGTPTHNGYVQVGFNGSVYYAHRLAWLLTHGVWPADEVDHINGIKDDNRLTNLRVVSSTENSRNIAKRNTNTSGVIGVTWDKARAKWKVMIGVNRKNVNIGRYTSLKEATGARHDAEVKYGFHTNHGRTMKAVQ